MLRGLSSLGALSPRFETPTTSRLSHRRHNKDEHIPDAAIQTHVLHKCGIVFQRAEIMHLNKEYRFLGEADVRYPGLKPGTRSPYRLRPATTGR